MNSHAGTFNPEDFSWRGLVMTPAAAAHIRDLVRKQPDMQGLRLGVKTRLRRLWLRSRANC